jgi:hypothetical protein
VRICTVCVVGGGSSCTKCIQSVYKCGLYKFFWRQCTVQFVGMADCVVQWMY